MTRLIVPPLRSSHADSRVVFERHGIGAIGIASATLATGAVVIAVLMGARSAIRTRVGD